MLPRSGKGTIEIQRFVVPYRVYGDSKPVLVLVNGAQQTMAVWISLIARFVGYFRIITFDFPGQGKGLIRSGSIGVTFDEQVAVLKHVITDVARGPVNIISASWGGIIAAAAACRFPEMVDKMVLASFGTKMNEALQATIKKGQALVENGAPAAEVGELLIESFGNQLPDSFKHQIAAQFANLSERNLRTFYAHSSFVEEIRDITAYIEFEKIQAKTLFINGELDEIIDMDDVIAAADRMPNAGTMKVPGAGHFLHFERQEIMGLYYEFLTD
jgi:pimeloyl-ACP methyl ester carboxylesterase